MNLIRGLNHGCVGYWRMEEPEWDGTAGEVTDISGYGNHGTAQNGLSTNASGKLGRGALNVRASNHSVEVPDAAALQLTSVGTVAAWIKTTSAYPSPDGSTLYHLIAGRLNSGADVNTAYYLVWQGTNVARYLLGVLSDGSNPSIFTDNFTGDLSDDWHHAVFTWDGNNIKLFVDSVQAGSDVEQTENAQVGSLNFRIGSYDAAGLGVLDSNVDEVTLFNRALNEDEIKSLYAGGVGKIIHPKRIEL